MSSSNLTRRERIFEALDAAQSVGTIDNYYVQSGMPGLHWVVWGTLVADHVYGAGSRMGTITRVYSTREIEAMLGIRS